MDHSPRLALLECMKILFLAHRIPFPPNKGDKIRAFNVLRHLAARHEVSVATLIDDEHDVQFVPRLEEMVYKLLFARIHRRVDRVLALRNLVLRKSISSAYFYSASLQHQIDLLIRKGSIDAFVCSSSPMAEYLFRSAWPDAIRHAQRIMDLIDIDSLKWAQYARKARPWTAWIYRHEAYHLAAYEQRIAREFDHVLVVSEQERALFPGGASPNLSAMSNGVDLDFFSPPRSSAKGATEPALVFTGLMDYWPNVEGVTWFVEHVFPRIRAAIPSVRFFIVGSRPCAHVQRLARHPGVTVTGFVEDVRDYLARAAVCVVPLRIARGIQNKVLEAMAMGKATVSTVQAFEGIQAQAGTDIVVAGDASEFAAAVLQLLSNPLRADEIGSCARHCVERHYSWAQNLAVLDAMLTGSRRAITASSLE